MNLGELEEKFKNLTNENFIFSYGFNNPHSYRGYYYQVAFEKAPGASLYEVKASIKEALARYFTGYKGGEYKFEVLTIANLADYGDCGPLDEVMLEELVKKMIEEYTMENPVETKKKRKTKAERDEENRIAKEKINAARWDSLVENYYQDLLDLVYDYSNLVDREDMKVVRSEEGYQFFDLSNNWRSSEKIVLPHPKDLPDTYNRDIEYKLSMAKEWIEDVRIQAEEAARVAKVKQEALSKLTEEERKALGV